MTYPELSLELLPPGRMLAPTVVGASIVGSRSQNGIGAVADVSGGGFMTVKYSEMYIPHTRSGAYRYYQGLSALLSGTGNEILVPLLTDNTAPFLDGEAPPRRGIPFSDGALFSDGSGFNQPRIIAVSHASAALNAGVIQIRMRRGSAIKMGMIFEIKHPTESCRSYIIRRVDSKVVVSGEIVYTVAIRPTLREAISASTRIRFERPRCIMRVDSMPPLDVKGYWDARPEISFVEAFQLAAVY